MYTNLSKVLYFAAFALNQFLNFYLQCGHNDVKSGDETLHIIGHFVNKTPFEIRVFTFMGR